MSDFSLLSSIKRFFSRTPRNRTELNYILKQATEEEVLEPNTFSMLEGVLEVQETHASDVMIPRPQMTTIESSAQIDDIMPMVVKSGHSRFPVTGENKDEIVGIILAKDLLSFSFNQSNPKLVLKDIMRPPVFVPESKRLNVLLQDFRVNRNHIAMVVDEYGRVTGLITIEDVIEQIVGDIEDEHDIDATPSITEQDDGSYTVKAWTSIEDFNNFFESEIDEEHSETIGGVVSQAMGHIPKRGESIKVENFYFTVLRADSRRVYLLNVVKSHQ